MRLTSPPIRVFHSLRSISNLLRKCVRKTKAKQVSVLSDAQDWIVRARRELVVKEVPGDKSVVGLWFEEINDQLAEWLVDWHSVGSGGDLAVSVYEVTSAVAIRWP